MLLQDITITGAFTSGGAGDHMKIRTFYLRYPGKNTPTVSRIKFA
jgi:hypothetical protein